MKRVPVEAAPLIKLEGDLSCPSTLVFRGAFVSVHPPVGMDAAKVDALRDALLRGGVAAVRVVPAREVSPLVAQAASHAASATLRETVMAMVDELPASCEKEPLRVILDGVLSEVGL